jgi:RNase P subunit RPR2
MKTTLSVLLVLSSLTAGAQTPAPAGAPAAGDQLRLRVNNVTEPSQHLEVYCQDAGCELMRFVITDFYQTRNVVLTRSELERRATVRIAREQRENGCQNCGTAYYPYKATRQILKDAKKQWRGGYFGEAILEYLAGAVVSIGETGALPATPITWYGGTYRPGQRNKKAAKRSLKRLSVLASGKAVVQVRTKQYEEFLGGLEQ